ncbi:4931_t:CDS:1, partial [Funneliformis geosporum]
VLVNIFNIHRIIRSMEPLLPDVAVPVWKLFKRTYGDIFISDSEIEKRIFLFSTYSYSDITVLTNIYKNTKNVQNLVHAVKDPMVTNEDIYKVTLAPVGVKRKPRTELEVKVAIRCILDALVALHELGYVHRDIRWDNILQLNDYSWILIDLECAGVDGESVHFDLKGWAPEAIETKVYTTKADVYMVGRLLRRVFITFSEEARAFERATTEFRLTAQEARQHSWLSDIRDYTK